MHMQPIFQRLYFCLDALKKVFLAGFRGLVGLMRAF
jgi:hypothetical protein